MARPKKTNTEAKTTKQTRKRRDLAERIKTFDTAKIMALKASAEATIRLIAAEGLRRQAEFATMQDTSVLNEPTNLNAGVTTAATVAQPYVVTFAQQSNGINEAASP
jgi:hypothetical protein